MKKGGYRIGVDIGGTFTDLVIHEEATGQLRTLKVSSTPRDPSEAVLTAVRRAHSEFGLDLPDVRQFTHATTIASNTLLQRAGAKTGLLATSGFRDVLEIQRHKRFHLFDLAYRKIAPLVPRNLTFDVPERVDYAGRVLLPLDEVALRAALAQLAEEKAEAIAICFLFSFMNPAHEQRAGAIAREMLPDAFITLSSDIYPQYREYERASTTAVNAILGPRVSSYLRSMSQALEQIGLAAPLHMMQSNGGVISWEDAGRMPCRIVESGPAAGVIAAACIGGLAGRQNLIAFDMGGTTAKAGLVENGAVHQSAGQEVGAGINISRLLQGGGYYIGAPTVDLAEVGAGGGSVAWIDEAGVLKVGPESAGADPGPIAYGLGGERVTVTDANLLLGRIPAELFLGGELALDVDRARRVAEEKIARPLGIPLDEACAAIIEVANASMLKMLRIVTVEKGLDPTDFTIVAFGGNGPVFAAELAGELGVKEVLVPPSPGLLSAQGLLVADIRHDFRQTFIHGIADIDMAGLEQAFVGLEKRGHAALLRYGVGPERVRVSRAAAMRYRRQAYEIDVPMPQGVLDEAGRQAVIERFHQVHERLYGRRDPAGLVQLVTLSVTISAETHPVAYRPVPAREAGAHIAARTTRQIFFPGTGRIDCLCLDRGELFADETVIGPAVIGGSESTVIVPPGWTAQSDQAGNIFLRRA
jgi:N-methylhydantoinase A